MRGVRVLYHIYTRVTQQQIFIVEPVERGRRRPWDVDDDDDDCLNKNSNWFCENTEN